MREGRCVIKKQILNLKKKGGKDCIIILSDSPTHFLEKKNEGKIRILRASVSENSKSLFNIFPQISKRHISLNSENCLK